MMAEQKSHIKTIIIILAIVALFTAMVFYFGFFKSTPPVRMKEIQIAGVVLPSPKSIEDFNLIDNQGNAFTKQNLQGHWTLMFFGFTNCGMVCPTTMAAMNQMYKGLQQELPNNKLPQVVLVTVDPDRDTQEKMNQYVTTFNPHFMGVRANMQETMKLEHQLNIAAVKVQAEGMGKNHYSMDHSTETLLINPDAQVVAYFSYPVKPAQMVKEYKLVISAS
jgi:protein SCO1/2